MADAALHLVLRDAAHEDLPSITRIHNQGIEDRVATLDAEPRNVDAAERWFAEHDGRYCVIVACDGEDVLGWASLNRYSHRCAYDGVADLSIYVRRDIRARGVGTSLLTALETRAIANGFHKIVLFALPFNEAGRRLYRRCGFDVVGTFRRQGILDGRFVDVVAMEKLLGGDMDQNGVSPR